MAFPFACGTRAPCNRGGSRRAPAGESEHGAAGFAGQDGAFQSRIGRLCLGARARLKLSRILNAWHPRRGHRPQPEPECAGKLTVPAKEWEDRFQPKDQPIDSPVDVLLEFPAGARREKFSPQGIPVSYPPSTISSPGGARWSRVVDRVDPLDLCL